MLKHAFPLLLPDPDSSWQQSAKIPLLFDRNRLSSILSPHPLRQKRQQADSVRFREFRCSAIRHSTLRALVEAAALLCSFRKAPRAIFLFLSIRRAFVSPNQRLPKADRLHLLTSRCSPLKLRYTATVSFSTTLRKSKHLYMRRLPAPQAVRRIVPDQKGGTSVSSDPNG